MRGSACAKMCISITPSRRNKLEECMRNQFIKAALGCAVTFLITTGAAAAQAPAQTPAAPGAPAAQASSAVANPTYISILLETTVNRPAAEVWKRVGKYCDIGEWLRIPCTITS